MCNAMAGSQASHLRQARTRRKGGTTVGFQQLETKVAGRSPMLCVATRCPYRTTRAASPTSSTSCPRPVTSHSAQGPDFRGRTRPPGIQRVTSSWSAGTSLRTTASVSSEARGDQTSVNRLHSILCQFARQRKTRVACLCASSCSKHGPYACRLRNAPCPCC